MIIKMGRKVQEVTKDEFDAIINQVGEAKKGSYFIYCLELKDRAEFVEENYTDKNSMRMRIFKLLKQGYRVHYTV